MQKLCRVPGAKQTFSRVQFDRLICMARLLGCIFFACRRGNSARSGLLLEPGLPNFIFGDGGWETGPTTPSFLSLWSLRLNLRSLRSLLLKPVPIRTSVVKALKIPSTDERFLL